MSTHIVVIEDEPCVQALLRDVLEAEGISVLTIGHGGAAQALLPEIRPDLILIDLMLPDMSGMQVAAWLRQHGHATTPMVAMSADRMNVLRAERSRLFQGWLAKPFDLDELLGLIEAHAGRSASYA